VGLGVMWLDVPFGVACLLAGLHHLGLAVGGRAPAVSALAYALMGLGMASMFLPAADPVPRPVWVAVFAASLVWFGVGVVRRGGGSLFGDAGHHVVGAAAMLFMLLADPHATMGTSGSGLLTSAVALALAAWFLSDVVRLLAHPVTANVPAAEPAVAAAVGGPGAALPAAPASHALVRGVPVACLAMDTAMVLMLVVMA
jgi:hypothetical protein